LAQPGQTVDGEAMNHLPRGACVVCGSSDARALSTTTLADGSEVEVCGTHALSHERAGGAARTISDLVALTEERRLFVDRRSVADDDLAAALAEAFAPRRTRGADRRRSGAS
jgi:hypothetical protein